MPADSKKLSDTPVTGAPQASKRNSVITMAVQTRRRGEAKAKTALLAKVDPAVKVKVERIASTLGISQAAAVELMLQSVGVDANGRPDFWDGPLPTDIHEELPLTKTA